VYDKWPTAADTLVEAAEHRLVEIQSRTEVTDKSKARMMITEAREDNQY